MGRVKQLFMDMREHDIHEDDAYHYEQWKSREREHSDERMLTSNELLGNMFKKMGESYE